MRPSRLPEQIKADIVLAASRMGIAPGNVGFSRRLEWVAHDGKLALRQAQRDPNSGRVTLWLDAIKGDAIETLKQCIACSTVLRWNIRASEDVDYIQDPDTGRFEGSRPHGGDGEAYGFASPNVLADLDLKGAVTQLGGKQQAALEKAAKDINKAVGIREAKETAIIGAWADGAENSVMMRSHTDWDRAVTASAMKGFLANQKSVLVFRQQEGGQSVLASFQAKGSIAEIHKNLLQDGIAFHTLVPNAGGAIVHVADLEGSQIEAIKKGAERYGSEVTIQFGRAQFIGDTSEFVGDKAGTGTDAEQRDRAREVYERVINQSQVEGVKDSWPSFRDHWGEALGGKFQQIAEEALSLWRADHPRTKEQTSALVKDIDAIIADGDKYKDYRDWYNRHKELAKDLFGAEYVPYFEKFLAATSINSFGQDNVNEALRATIHYINKGTFEPKNYKNVLPAVRDELLKVQHGSPLTGLKVVPFAEALAGNWDRAPADRHMKRLLFQNPSQGPNETQARVTDTVIRALAKSMGWQTAELQAVMWCVEKSREENGNSAVIYDYLQYMQTQETRTRALLAEHNLVRTRAEAGFQETGKSFDEDKIEKILKAEAEAWSNAQLLLTLFQKIQDEVGNNLTAEAVLAELNKSELKQ